MGLSHSRHHDSLSLTHAIKYLDLIQTDPEKYNLEHKNILKNIEDTLGKDRVKEILNDKNNPLSRHRSYDFRIAQKDLEILINEGVYWYPPDHFKYQPINSFADFYLKAFNNDMPIYITTDSILHAFHKSFNSILSDIEEQFLYEITRKFLISTINTILGLLHEKSPSPSHHQDNTLLLDVLKYLLVPYRLLVAGVVIMDKPSSANGGLSGAGTGLSSGLGDTGLNGGPAGAGLGDINGNPGDLGGGSSSASHEEKEVDVKVHANAGMPAESLHGIEGSASQKKEQQQQQVKEEEEYRLKIELIPQEIEQSVKEILDRLSNKNTEFELKLFKLAPNGSTSDAGSGDNHDKEALAKSNAKNVIVYTNMFEPRSHYVKSIKLRNYFKCLTWLTLATFNIRDDITIIWALCYIIFGIVSPANTTTTTSTTSATTTASSYNSQTQYQYLNEFIKCMSGSSLYPSLIDIYHIGQKIGLGDMIQLTRDEEIKLIDCIFKRKSNVDEVIVEQMKEIYLKECKGNIGIIPQSWTIDNWLIHDLYASNIQKKVTIGNIIYGLFDNPYNKSTAAIPKLETDKHLIQSSMLHHKSKWHNCLFTSWLLVLSTLSKRENYPKSLIYDTKAWKQKQYNTQVGSYAELKHDVLLNIEHLALEGCSSTDVYVEPNVECWIELKELVKFVWKMVSLILPGMMTVENLQEKQDQIQQIATFLKGFDSTLDMLIVATKYQLKDEPIPLDLYESLKGIIYRGNIDYLQAEMKGWYPQLFYNDYDQSYLRYECTVSSIFTSHPQLHGEDYNLHVALKRPNIGMILITNEKTSEKKCFLMSGYNPYELYLPLDKIVIDQIDDDKGVENLIGLSW